MEKSNKILHDWRYKHGFAGTPLYQCWIDMKHRCSNPKYRDYHRYGGRGINVCNEWLTFIPFMEWALSHGYQKGLEVDRINNDGNYEPANCKWSTQQQQSLNKHRKETWAIYHNGKYLWGVYLTRNRKPIYVGTYKTIPEAIIARDKFVAEFDKNLI
jgi:hypothetical protein